MFRRYQNPPQQGTDVLPNVMQAAPVVRFAGVEPGSAQARRLMARYYGLISGFLRAQRQNQSLGGLNDVNVTRTFQDVTVTYSRRFGQEIFVVQPRAGVKAPRENVLEAPLGVVFSFSASANTTDAGFDPDSVETLSATATWSINGISFSAGYEADIRNFSEIDEERQSGTWTVAVGCLPKPSNGPIPSPTPIDPLTPSMTIHYYDPSDPHLVALPLSVLDPNGLVNMTLTVTDTSSMDRNLGAMYSVSATFYSRNPRLTRPVLEGWVNISNVTANQVFVRDALRAFGGSVFLSDNGSSDSKSGAANLSPDFDKDYGRVIPTDQRSKYLLWT